MSRIKTQKDFDFFIGQLYVLIADEVSRKANEIYTPKHIANFCIANIVREKNNNLYKYYYYRLGKPRLLVARSKGELAEEFEKQIKQLFKNV